MKLLILHGPNMNLFGIRSSKEGKNTTLDKINRHLRKFVRNKVMTILFFCQKILINESCNNF